MRSRSFLVGVATAVALAGCSSFSLPTLPSPQPAVTRSEFDDVPIPKGLVYQRDRSTIIESGTMKSARLIYRGAVEVEALRVQMRGGLEAFGWHQLTSATSADLGTIQVYEKDGNTLQVLVRDAAAGIAELELIASRVKRPEVTGKTDLTSELRR